MTNTRLAPLVTPQLHRMCHELAHFCSTILRLSSSLCGVVWCTEHTYVQLCKKAHMCLVDLIQWGCTVRALRAHYAQSLCKTVPKLHTSV